MQGFPEFDAIMPTSVLESICRIANVKYHHHDSFREPPYKDDPLLSRAICVIYSEPFSPWQMAINEDGTVVFPWLHTLQQVTRIQMRIVDALVVSKLSDEERLRRHCAMASREVATWPAWKQNILQAADKSTRQAPRLIESNE